MKRRNFLQSTLATFLAACSRPISSQSQPSSVGNQGSPEQVTLNEPPSQGSAPTQGGDPTPEVERLDPEPVALEGYPFELGVASGDPTSSSIMLWTRLSGTVPPETPLVWEVAHDEHFEQLVDTGRYLAKQDDGHTVRVDVTDLPSATQFYYRFRVGTEQSPLGKTRTFTPPGQNAPPLRIAIASCQAAEDGAYAAHRSIAEADIDLVVWLGDYIYGSAADLEGYREAYARYRSDPALQAAHAAHPWVMIWDDHEVANDFDARVDPQQRQAALQAWRENQPVRLPSPDSQGLVGYRYFDVGNLCRLLLLDARQYAVPKSILGETQMKWMLEHLEHPGTWTIVASPVLTSGLDAPTQYLDIDGPLLPYTWDGAPNDRQALAAKLSGLDAAVVSGDLHTAMVLDLMLDGAGDIAEPAAPEFMAPSISSNFPARFEKFAPLLSLFNSHLKLIDTNNGWLQMEISDQAMTATFHFVENSDDSTSEVLAGPTYVVRRGESTATRL